MSINDQKISNGDFFEAKERLGLLSVGDPGSQDKLQVTDTFLIATARKVDAKIKDHPKLKRTLVTVRKYARKIKHRLQSRSAAVTPSTASTHIEPSDDVIRAKVAKIILKKQVSPKISIVIPAWNKVGYSLSCITSLAERLDVLKNPSFEVILVDNGSSDSTPLLKRIKNLVYVHNEENLGFVGGCNAGFEAAKGEYVIFLNNDAEVTPDWLTTLYNTIENDASIGIVGSKIIYPNGVLQEAGGLIFKDADGLNYGKFDQADSYQYNYVRDVDYCSGASIIIRHSLMKKFGGFDTLYQPAYYEDTDLSFKVRKEGLRVVYQPDSVIYHIEGGTAGTSTSTGFKKYQAINKDKFLKRWGSILKKDHVTANDYYLGRDRSGDKLALIIEEALPTPDKDSGSVRMVAMIKSLQKLGYKVTFWPNNLTRTIPYAHNLQQMGVEVVYGNIDFMQFSKLYGHSYNLVIMSRPEICAKYINICKTLYTNAKVIYDTVDLHYVRLARQAEFESSNAEALIEQSKWYEKLEKGLMQRADTTLLVSEKEIEMLRTSGVDANLAVISNIHSLDLESYKSTYEKRHDIIFVGNYAHIPNRDAARWLSKEIFPLIRKQLPSVTLHLVGANLSDELSREIQGTGVKVHGFVEDDQLVKLLRTSRVFLAPLRYGAGVKGKIGQAIEHGLPVVTTSIGAEGMYLVNGESCIEADVPELFAHGVAELYTNKKLWNEVQTNAKTVLVDYFSADAATKDLKKILD
ncbi:MAG: glycosyltransferase [Candidatus Saccharimonadales bacterium]